MNENSANGRIAGGGKPVIGVIGGIGPSAGLDFVQKILANTRARKDQDHLDCILISCSSIIPDRTEFILRGETENPAEGILESARRLYLAGARTVAVACNTAHSERIFSPFYSMTQESMPELTIVNMLETCAAYVKTSLKVTSLGLLATLGTYQSRVYHEYFREDDGFLLLEPEESGRKKIHDAIYNENFGIKTHSHPVMPRATDQISHEIYRLMDRGAEAVILGCTELPLAIHSRNYPLPIIDPGLLSARKLIELTAPEKLLPADF